MHVLLEMCHDVVSAPNVFIFTTKLDAFLFNRCFDYVCIVGKEIDFIRLCLSFHQIINNYKVTVKPG